VVAVVSDEARASFCRKLGADATINHTEGPVAPSLRKITAGRGVDLIFDPVGGSLAEDAATALSRHGRLLAVGFASGQWPKLATLELVVTNTSLVGVFAGGYTRDELDDIHANLSRLVSRGQLTNAVTAEVSFDELPGALQRIADRRVVGKLVMVP
jgi:NADPH2:quinone reductase